MKPIVFVLGLVGAASVLLLQPWHSCRRHGAYTTIRPTRSSCTWYSWNSSASLKTIASAQADYRGNDRDENGIQDFWRMDIAGLYGVVPPGSTEMIKLIEISIAGADPAPTGTLTLGTAGPGQVTRDEYALFAPQAGYLFSALRHADEDPNALDTHARFAACAYPADYGTTGIWTYIISEGNTIFKRDLGRPGPPDVFPDEATLKREWSKLD